MHAVTLHAGALLRQRREIARLHCFAPVRHYVASELVADVRDISRRLARAQQQFHGFFTKMFRLNNYRHDSGGSVYALYVQYLSARVR